MKAALMLQAEPRPLTTMALLLALAFKPMKVVPELLTEALLVRTRRVREPLVPTVIVLGTLVETPSRILVSPSATNWACVEAGNKSKPFAMSRQKRAPRTDTVPTE